MLTLHMMLGTELQLCNIFIGREILDTKNKGLSQGHHNTNTASGQVKKLLKEALATILTKKIICFGNW